MTEELDELLEDVLATETCDPALVLRYDADPGSLSAAEREEVEAWLATPAGRDALAAMRALQGSPALRRPVEPEARRTLGAEPARGAAPAHRPRGWTRERRALLVAVAAAIAAALIFWRADPLGRGTESPDGEQIARDLPREPQPLPLPPAPSAPTADVQESPTPEVEHVPPAEVPAPPAAERSGHAPAEPAPREPERPEPQPVLLALAMPNYARPDGASLGHLDAALRSSASPARPFALSPDHVGRTSRPEPTLYWHLAELPAEGTQVWLAIVDESRAESLLEVQLPTPSRAGLQKLPLSGRARLVPGVDYTWSIALRSDPDDPSSDALAFGWIRYEPLAANVAAALASAAPGERPAAFAANGRFYDALDELEALQSQHAGDARIASARDALLEQAGIEPAQVR